VEESAFRIRLSGQKSNSSSRKGSVTSIGLDIRLRAKRKSERK
jgi:hypothetical protein